MTATWRTVEVVAAREVGRGAHVFSTDGGAALAGAAPGQFVMLRGAWGRDPLLARAFSILRVDGDRVDYLVKVHGRGTALLGALAPGDALAVLGPLGRPFPTGAPGAAEVLVAGGVGLAPLLWYAERAGGGALDVVYGARTAAELVLLDAIAATGARVTLTTEDGSAPHGGPPAIPGRVTDVLPSVLARSAAGARVLSCGPNAMMRAVAEVASAAGRACLLSLESEMACGIGVCLGCPVATAPGAARAYVYCCTDGPVFDARDVVVP